MKPTWPSGWYSEEAAEAPRITLPQTAAELSGDGLQTHILNAMELAEQKRFAEARIVLDHLRARQTLGSEGYQALTSSMSILALRAGDMDAFQQDAAALDRNLADKVRVAPEWVDVIALYRAISGADLPVNTPPELRDWLRGLPVDESDGSA